MMCAGLIGHRTFAYGDARRIGIYGFGAAWHIAVPVARYDGRRIFGFVLEQETNAYGLLPESQWRGLQGPAGAARSAMA